MINLDFYKTGDGTKQFWGDDVAPMFTAMVQAWVWAENMATNIVVKRPPVSTKLSAKKKTPPWSLHEYCKSGKGELFVLHRFRSMVSY